MTTLPKGYILHGTYELEAVLGQGGFAITYEARHTKLGTHHAIKEYYPRGVTERSGSTVHPAEGEESRNSFAKGMDSFLREAQTLTKFSHPNIVAIQDYFTENGTAYLVMPYLAGETLDAVLKKCPGSKMTVQAMKQWLLPLLDGLATLHKTNFLHRDIKPSNIYLTGNATPILIDFGAARSAMGQLTHGFTVVLTPEYAPPEQHTAIVSSQGPWTDIYALGAVMYRCLLGTPPPDSNTRQLAVIHEEKDPVELAYTSLAVASNEHMAATITRCLDLNSKTRIRSVSELKNLLADKPASTVERSSSIDENILGRISLLSSVSELKNLLADKSASPAERSSSIDENIVGRFEFINEEEKAGGSGSRDNSTDIVGRFEFINEEEKAGGSGSRDNSTDKDELTDEEVIVFRMYKIFYTVCFLILCLFCIYALFQYSSISFYSPSAPQSPPPSPRPSAPQSSPPSPKQTESKQTAPRVDVCTAMLDNLQQGESAYIRREYEMAESFLRVGIDSLCRSHESDRMRGANILGMTYEHQGAHYHAAKMYELAANGGYNNARYNLARCYNEGKGVTQNGQKALELFTEAANNGDGDAAEQAAYCYEKSKKYKTALFWYKKALKLGALNTADIKKAIDRVRNAMN